MGDQIIFDGAINNAIGSIWSIRTMWQVSAAGALQAGRPAQGEVLSTILQQKADKTRVISLLEQQKSLIFYLELHLVVERLPVQTKVTLCWVELNFVREVDHTGPPALCCDFSADGQRALTGWDWNVVAAWGDVDMETTWATAMAPGATKLEIPIVFTGSWRTQREIEHRLHQVGFAADLSENKSKRKCWFATEKNNLKIKNIKTAHKAAETICKSKSGNWNSSGGR